MDQILGSEAIVPSRLQTHQNNLYHASQIAYPSQISYLVYFQEQRHSEGSNLCLGSANTSL